MRFIAALLLAVCSIWLSGQPAVAGKRVGLVIGNSAYQSVPRLINPTNDSGAMSAILKNAGFDVVELKRDLKAHEMRRALRDFAGSVRDADVAVVYFAGHGMEIDGVNYVIPVDAVLERDIDAFDEAVPLDRILQVVDGAKQLRLIILDACRDNPFNNTMKRTIGSRAISRGLAKVDPSNPNTLVAFAAKAGSTASDGENKNSPFTAALVKYLPKPGLDLRKAFGFARDDVLKATNNKQEPFVYGSLGGDDFPLVPAVTAAPVDPPSTSDSSAAVRRDYEFAERVGTMEAWDFFLSTYSSGFYAKLAQAQRNKLAAEEARLAATEKAKAAAAAEKLLAAEGAAAKEQAIAAKQAKAAVEARVAAEKKEAIEIGKVADAERMKAAGLAKAAQVDETANAANEAKAAVRGKTAETPVSPADSEKAGRDSKPVGSLAALTPPNDAGQPNPKPEKYAAGEILRLLQTELRRVGCKVGAVDGKWNSSAQTSLELFNKNAHTSFDVKVASVDALEAVLSKPTRVCPLVCEKGQAAEGDRCVDISCRRGFFLNSDGSCEKRAEAVAKSRRAERRAPAPSRSQRSGGRKCFVLGGTNYCE